jgi:chemotaxis protein histidine kinase CheA
MPETAVLPAEDSTIKIDPRQFDKMMSLSGELVIIRSQYARLEGLLHHDIERQKNLSLNLKKMQALIELAIKSPERIERTHAELQEALNTALPLARYDQALAHIQAMAQTTSSLEKTSSEMQSGIMLARKNATGDQSKTMLTLAIIQSLLVVVGGEIYAFPLESVTEIIKIARKDIYTVDGNTTIKLRDHALSLVELEKVIQAKPNTISDDDEKRVVIITDGKNQLGVLVDAMVGKDEVVLKSFTRHFSRVKGIIGASILADGNVALILDPATIINESR